MSTPLYNALRALAAQNTARFHMPGHKGQPAFPGFDALFAIDFTETYGTGNLYEAEGPIRQAEQLAAAFFRVTDCHFLTGGSSQGIVAMLGAVCGDGGKVLLDRACHKSAMHACALFDLEPAFLSPDVLPYAGCGGVIDLAAAEEALQANPDAAALLVVSPNYYGVMQPIAELAALCHRCGKKLLVDGAHGAHLDASGCRNPVAAGADAAVLSAHKTLPALGQAAYLLCGPSIDSAGLRRFEAMCGTSSPSYPIMASLDLAREFLQTPGGKRSKTLHASGFRLVANLFPVPIESFLFFLSCYAIQLLQRERRIRQRLYRNAHQFERVIIGRAPVGIQMATAAAAMNNRPLSALAHPYANWIHHAAAIRGTIPGFIVQMQTA